MTTDSNDKPASSPVPATGSHDHDHEHDHGAPGHVHGPGCNHHHHKLEPFVRTQAKVGRNDPCPCGSGKKAKKCCGA